MCADVGGQGGCYQCGCGPEEHRDADGVKKEVDFVVMILHLEKRMSKSWKIEPMQKVIKAFIGIPQAASSNCNQGQKLMSLAPRRRKPKARGQMRFKTKQHNTPERRTLAAHQD